MFPDYSGIQLEIDNRKISGKSPNIWNSNDTLLNNPQAREEIKKEIRKYF